MKQAGLFLLVVMLMSFTRTGNTGDWIKPGEERFKIDAGAFFAAIDTNVRVDSKELGKGTDINLEDDLGFDDSNTSFLLNGYWRFANRHRLFGGYFAIDRDTMGILSKEMQIGDDIYPIGADVSSEFNFKIIPIAYGYSFVNNEKHEFTGIIGLHWYKADFSIEGYAFAGSGGFSGSTSADADVPLPLIGFAYQYRFTERWTAGALAQAFYLNTSGGSDFDFSGGLMNFAIRTEYWIFNNVGVGAALNYFYLNVDVEDDDWKGSLDYKYFGPQVYVTVRF